MKVLLIGVGTVGEVIARLSAGAPWLEQMVLADHDVERAERIAGELGDGTTHPVAQIDASDADAVAALARSYGVDLVLNAVDPRFVMPVLEGALAADADYIDLALSTSTPHPTEPYAKVGRLIGDEQFAMDAAWRERGRLALVGLGISPGLAQVFATHAAKHRFDEIHDINIRVGGDMRVEGYPIATMFNIWTTIEECLNPALVWEKERGFFTLPPFSEPERFVFPEGIGPVECVHVEHEDVAMLARSLDARRITFKYALGEQFIVALMLLHALGLDRTDPIEVDGQQVIPRNVVAALVPDPSTLGDAMVGRAIVGTHVTGLKDGQPLEIFSYQLCDAQETMAKFGMQPVGWQTGFNAVIAMELLATGVWQGTGVRSVESFDPDPYLAIMDRDGIHHATIELEPGTAFA
jgi:saccharopine dehydrogenase-like NADP-dependent oxidoreductase